MLSSWSLIQLVDLLGSSGCYYLAALFCNWVAGIYVEPASLYSCFYLLQNELCRMRLDVSMLDELVCEYCVYRGIVDSGITSTSGKIQIFLSLLQFFPFFIARNSDYFFIKIFMIPSEMRTGSQPKVNHPEPGCSSSRNCSLEVDSGANKHSDGETSVNNTHMDGSPENNADVSSIRGMDVELRYACEPTSNQEDCSTSGLHQPENPSVQQRYRTLRTGERSKRKRWRGRHDDQDFSYGVPFDECSKQEPSTTTQVSSTFISKEQQVLV